MIANRVIAGLSIKNWNVWYEQLDLFKWKKLSGMLVIFIFYAKTLVQSNRRSRIKEVHMGNF